MKRQDFVDYISNYETEMRDRMVTMKNAYLEAEKQEIYKMCRKFSRVSIPEDREIHVGIKEEILRPYFLRSLTFFESSLISDYFAEKTKEIKVVRDKGRTSDGIGLKYSYGGGRPLSMKLVIPSGNLTMNDQIGYAHEMGHVPELVILRKSFLEYDEVLSMFLEFVVHLRKYPEFQNALNHFLFVRLPMEQDIARDILKIYKNANSSDPLIQKYHQLLIAEWYTFLESLEYAIQLVLRSQDDLRAVATEIEKVLEGKSLIEVADSLNINTDGCPMLQQEYRRIGRL